MASRPSTPNWRCVSLADMHELLSALKTRLPEVKNEEQDSLLLALLSDAEALIKNLSWQDEVPKELQNTQVRIAVMLYNRMGAEGEAARTEGDIRRAFDFLPADIKGEIISRRMARPGGYR